MFAADRINEIVDHLTHQPRIPANNNPAAREGEKNNDLIRYISIKPTNDECGICFNSLSDGKEVVAHIKNVQQQPLHPYHKTCVRTALKINETCPLCRASLDPDAPFPLSLKEKLIELCTSLLPIGKAAVIAKIVQMIFTTAFTSEEMLLGSLQL